MLEALVSGDGPGVRGTAFVAPREGDAVGFSSVEFRAWNGLGYLHGLAVDPDLRRRGVASDLVRRAEDSVREQGGRGIHVDTPVNNKPAQVFYLALGYGFAHKMPEYYGEKLDGVTFLKLFRPPEEGAG